MKNYVNSLKIIKKELNLSQLDAVYYSNNMEDNNILLIQGPPGTGKISTIIGIISSILKFKKDSKLLICTQSNNLNLL